MSSHPARHDHRRADSSVPDPAHKGAPQQNPHELGRANSNRTVAVTLGVGIGLILFLLALPYLGWL
ncbi:hypothetical protein [Nesterenkonia lutea]|uniref:Uncharacterized protein n=1 Tax=Nesterenkonia lutea TaxID=272919 RepID=A0ABR9JH36_9MICC|nr:hypothetical protein [Nesterenkonia lutea]MBE1525248.1 hypothetical protein [Nesterenkonia lutea]